MDRMRLHLVRHGDARPGSPDSLRPLSPLGRGEIERLADRAVAAGVDVVEIRHSGLVRARETAEILAARLQPSRGIAVMSGIRPEDDETTAAAELALLHEPVLVVSHMPFIASLTERLLGPRSGAEPYRTSEMRCLTRAGDRWTLAYVLDGRD
jgi:phosphohistidine phosphatase